MAGSRLMISGRLGHRVGGGGGQWWLEVREHQLKMHGSMKWGFMLEVSVSLAMPPNLLARPAQLFSAGRRCPRTPTSP